MTIKRALLSVSDKTGIVELGKRLEQLGIEIVSTGGTAKLLTEGGVAVTPIEDVTGFPEIMDGRVKTLHPNVHAGLLALRGDKEHMATLEQHNITPIDLVVVNLYPFRETIAKEGVTEAEAIEQIDIGGPSMLRSAAKNFQSVTVVSDPGDYEAVIAEIEAAGNTSLETRKKLARKVFSLTHMYDEAIEHYFRTQLGEPELMNLHYEKVMTLRYGENPHQKAAFFKNPINTDGNITNADVLHGKQLSFNNIVDADSAFELVRDFERSAAGVIKHNNPCGIATADTIEEALRYSHQVDPMSAFGGVIALNRECSEECAEYICSNKWFVEIVIAPSYAKKALERLQKRKNLRILQTGSLEKYRDSRDIKKVEGGILIQSKDDDLIRPEDLTVMTKKEPSVAEKRALLFADIVAKHVHSNAVVFAKILLSGEKPEKRTISDVAVEAAVSSGSGYIEVATGIGAGQMSRLDAVHIAVHKGGDRIAGSVMASDAFFPFPDAVERAAEAGAVAIIQPGGSIRDDEVVERANELGLSMVSTGLRHFKH